MLYVLPLPPRPNLESYKKRAKELAKICKAGDRVALRAWVAEWIEALVKLQEADDGQPRLGHRALTPAEIERLIGRTADGIAKNLDWARGQADCSLSRAQLALAREHGFVSWPKFATHLEELARARSPVRAFESAVDAIVGGDLAGLATLLKKKPALVRERSTREHRSTLLHYVSANGVEDYRQKTPANIVQITKLLLDAGADVNAESDAYGGRSTTLGLTATSYHPEAAGVQLELLQVLINAGATIDPPDGGSAVNGCLRNGRGNAAEFLAARGAKLDLEGAAGIGRIDAVKQFFAADGSLKPPATAAQLYAGLAWACEFGRTEVVEFLLQTGMPLDPSLMRGKQTGLHWAAYYGHADIIQLLLDRGAPVDVIDDHHRGAPLEWALYGWDGSAQNAEGFYRVVGLLARAGAKLDAKWYESGPERQRVVAKIQADPRMQAALRGE
ncbi:MAG TPA: ankyrin repeat domain-containing protein [Humisphaera sp.]|jgi:ankyrin repeat protein|nr:ankyrin repeat domain-containing protein [Humisphaera sp.]